jgi:hypothetical protein
LLLAREFTAKRIEFGCLGLICAPADGVNTAVELRSGRHAP